MRKILATGAILLSVALFAAAAQASDSYQKMHNEHHSGDGHHGHHSGEYQGHDHHGEGERVRGGAIVQSDTFTTPRTVANAAATVVILDRLGWSDCGPRRRVRVSA